jgi:hypothetical protein
LGFSAVRAVADRTGRARRAAGGGGIGASFGHLAPKNTKDGNFGPDLRQNDEFAADKSKSGISMVQNRKNMDLAGFDVRPPPIRPHCPSLTFSPPLFAAFPYKMMALSFWQFRRGICGG